jgi:hypothetical protein
MFRSLESPRRRRARATPLNFDALEGRSLLAGDVTVQLLQGSAFLVGDGQGNDIQVDQAGLPANELRVTGESGTTIDGQTGPLVVTVTQDLKIDLKDGGDFVRLNNVAVARDVSIAMGSGPPIPSTCCRARSAGT